jgi:hypothetical protein
MKFRIFVAVACFRPGRAKDLSAPLYGTYLYIGNETCVIRTKVLRSRKEIKGQFNMAQNLILYVSYIFRFSEIFFVKYYEVDPTDLRETEKSCNSHENGPADCHICDVKLSCRSDKHWHQTTQYFYLYSYVAPITTNTLSVGLPDRGHLWAKVSCISNFTVYNPTMARVWDTPSFKVFFVARTEQYIDTKIHTIIQHASHIFRHFFGHFQGGVPQRKRKKHKIG